MFRAAEIGFVDQHLVPGAPIGRHDATMVGFELQRAYDLARPALLRNTTLSRVDPHFPALSTFLPLDPERDRYIVDLASGSVDPDPVPVIEDGSRPLIFYGLDEARTLFLTKTPSLELRIDY